MPHFYSEIITDARRARLGYELIQLAESPQRELIRVSPRENAGIGIDSDLPSPFFISKYAEGPSADYHQWSLFGNDSNNVGIEDELVQKVILLMDEETIEHLKKLTERQRQGASYGLGFGAMASPSAGIIGSIYGDAARAAREPKKVQAKIQALFSDQQWRDYAKKLNVQLLAFAEEGFQKDRENIKNELGNAAVEALEEILSVYARDIGTR